MNNDNKEYLELQNVLVNGATISDVEVKNNMTYFKIDGRQFNTYANKVEHIDSPLFNHPFNRFMAKRHNTPEGIEEERQTSDRINEEMDLWYKHKNTIYMLIFMRALELLAKGGVIPFVEYIDYHFDVIPNGDNCNELINRLEDKT